jgi:D-alanyl-D-alanine carboxypeptidase
LSAPIILRPQKRGGQNREASGQTQKARIKGDNKISRERGLVRPLMLARIAAIFMAVASNTVSPFASAGPALLFDAADGKVLYAEDQDDQWHPASLTKMMTAYVVFEAIKEGKLKLDTKISCSAFASSQPPTKVGLAVGAQMNVATALQVMIIQSANDVAVMLAESVSGSHEAFVERMNATAMRLGMTRTKFVNANGLPEAEQVTTARDLARLATAILRDYPDHARLWSLLEIHIGKRHFGTFNGLLVNYAGADGMKTGFTCDSGFNVVASATRDGHKLIAVVLGEKTAGQRSLRASSLLEHGFQTYDWKALFPSSSIESLPIAADAKGPTTVRQTVISWVCGTARLALAKLSRKKEQPITEGEGGETVAKQQKKVRPADKTKSTAVAKTSPDWHPW